MRSRAFCLGFGSLLVANAVAAADASPPAKNRPPHILGSAPREYFVLDPVEIRWGKELRFQLGANDPDGDTVELRMEDGKDIEGATFDATDRVFRWTPTQAQKGTHEIRFVASDGTLSETRVARLRVVDNRAPVFHGLRDSVHANSGSEFRLEFSATDQDGDALAYQVSDLPPGATFEGSHVKWKPREAQIGVHTMRVSVGDGEASATRDVEIVVEDEWNTTFLPGLYYSLWDPGARASYGVFHGLSMEIVPYAWIHRNANRGPSHGRLTVRADLLNSTRAGVGIALIYSLGLDLSIERNPYRRWLIPFFGVDVGGIVQGKFGHHFQTSPHLGLYLWATRNVFVSVSGAYQIVPSQLDTLGGWRTMAGLNLTMW